MEAAGAGLWEGNWTAGLEVGGLAECHCRAGAGVDECEALGVEVEAVGGCAVEGVAQDGGAEAVGVGCVYTELMGAPCLGEEEDTVCVEHLVVGDGVFAMLTVDDLAGTVEGIGQEWQGDGAFGGQAGGRCAAEQGDVFFFYRLPIELLLQIFVGRFVLSKEEEARGVHVETVHVDGLGMLLADNVEQRGHVVFAGGGE